MSVGGQRHAPAALSPGMTRYPLYRTLGGPQGRSGRVRKISPPPAFDPRTVQLVASHYTDWAIPRYTQPPIQRLQDAPFYCRFSFPTFTSASRQKVSLLSNKTPNVSCRLQSGLLPSYGREDRCGTKKENTVLLYGGSYPRRRKWRHRTPTPARSQVKVSRTKQKPQAFNNTWQDAETDRRLYDQLLLNNQINQVNQPRSLTSVM
jgi:hypothetical protein